ncbi:hypothetical protein Lal_00005927, partial [Lupinus albus]
GIKVHVISEGTVLIRADGVLIHSPIRNRLPSSESLGRSSNRKSGRDINKLPTDENLKWRGIHLASVCNLCLAEEETSNAYPFTTNLQLPSINGSLVWWVLTSTILMFLTCWIPLLILVLLRNKSRFEGLPFSLFQSSNRIKLDTCITAFNVSTNFNKAPLYKEVIRCPPCLGWIKYNTNGAAHGDNKGDCLGFFATYLGIENSTFAELFSAFIRGWHHLWLECDSTWVVDIFNGNSLSPWKLSNFWNHCSGLWDSMMNLRVTHIYRDIFVNIYRDIFVNNSKLSWTILCMPYICVFSLI